MINLLMDLFSIIGWIVIIIILLLFFMMIFGVFNDKWHKEFKLEAKKLENERQRRRETTGNTASSDNFMSGLKGKFEIPKDVVYDIKDLKDSKISKKRLNSFIKWLKTKDSKILNIIKDNKSLSVEIPSLNFAFTLVTREDGVIKNPEFDDNFDAYNIQGFLTYQVDEISIQNLVKLLSGAEIGEDALYEIFEDGTWSSYESEIFSDFYTFEDDLRIPEDAVTPGYNNYFEGNISGGGFSGPISDGEQILYATVNVDYQDEIIIINGSNFKFKEGEEECLIVLLMASYKPSLLKRIKESLK